jgi:hypothetical protein
MDQHGRARKPTGPVRIDDAMTRWTDPKSVVLDGTVYSFEAHVWLLRAAWGTHRASIASRDALAIRVQLALTLSGDGRALVIDDRQAP